MRDLAACAHDFPARPDWAWLRWFWAGTGLFLEGVRLADVAASARGRLACLASPYADFPGGPVLAADYAAEWLAHLGVAGIPAVAPACLAAWADRPAADPAGVACVSDLVIVPPADGWAQSAEVWQAVCLSLAAAQPVYVLGGGAARAADDEREMVL